MKTPLKLFVNRESGLLSGVPDSLSRNRIMRVCKVDNCGRKHSGHGYCQTHIARLNKGLDLSAPVVKRVQHGRSRSREYYSWLTMIQRCTNPNNTNYHKYGARGISVCKRWRDGFEYFLEDMGARPEGYTLDRINNDGNYEPSNCRWASMEEQTWNKRPKKNSSGYAGIYASHSKWGAKFRSEHLGTFDTKLEASNAYQEAKAKYLQDKQPIARISKDKLMGLFE